MSLPHIPQQINHFLLVTLQQLLHTRHLFGLLHVCPHNVVDILFQPLGLVVGEPAYDVLVQVLFLRYLPVKLFGPVVNQGLLLQAIHLFHPMSDLLLLVSEISP